MYTNKPLSIYTLYTNKHFLFKISCNILDCKLYCISLWNIITEPGFVYQSMYFHNYVIAVYLEKKRHKTYLTLYYAL